MLGITNIDVQNGYTQIKLNTFNHMTSFEVPKLNHIIFKCTYMFWPWFPCPVVENRFVSFPDIM